MNNIDVRGDANTGKWVRVANDIHKHWPPTNNDDSTISFNVKRKTHINWIRRSKNKTWNERGNYL
jgi:hypothetical protein